MEAGGSLIKIPPIHERGGFATYRIKSYTTGMAGQTKSESFGLLGEMSNENLSRLRYLTRESGLPDPYKAFMKQRAGAATRRIAFELTFSQWWDFWNDHYSLRGSGQDDLCMARFGDVGPYAIDNIYLTTGRGNLLDYAVSEKKEHDRSAIKAKRSAELQALIRSVENMPPPQYTYDQVVAMLKLGVPFNIHAEGPKVGHELSQ